MLELINLVLAVLIANEGQMSEAEALAILNVTERRPKWLISQVHPDKHPGFLEEAIAAAARVNQAMDVRSRHVNEVLNACAVSGHGTRIYDLDFIRVVPGAGPRV